MALVADRIVPTLTEIGEDVGTLTSVQGDPQTLVTVSNTLVGSINELKGEIDALSGGGSATSLEDLTDVDLTTPVADDMLRHNGAGQFVNVPTTDYGFAFLSLADQAALMALVPAASETVQGKVELATNAEAIAGTDTARATTPAGVAAAIAAVVDSAPSTLNTLNELAAALGDDPNFATTVTTSIGTKQNSHANLTAFSGLSLVADRLPYANGAGTLALATFTAAGRALLDDADVAAQRTTLDVWSKTEVGDVTTDLLTVYTTARDGV